MSAPEVPDWKGVKTFYPEMTMSVTAPVPDVLGTLASALEGAKFKIKDRGAAGFKARYVNWFDIVAGTFNKTSLGITATPDGNATHVLVNATSTGEHMTGPKRASEGLSSAVRELRRRGIDVTTTPWVVPEDRKKGKRR